MPIQFDKYDQQKIDRLKNHLVLMAEKQKPKFYEIYVDTLKAVPKTDEPRDFDAYEDYMSADTAQVKIVIYNSGASPRNDQYVFSMDARNREEAVMQGLNGLPTKTYSRNSLFELKADYDRKAEVSREVMRLKQEIEELNNELDEKCDYIKELEEEIDEARANGNKIGGVHLGDVLSVALEGMVRRNTHLLAKMPAAKGLAGIIEEDNRKQALGNTKPEPETEASFKRKDENENAGANPLSAQEKEFIRIFHELQKYFNNEELTQVMGILDYLCRDKTHLNSIVDLLNEKINQSKN